MIGYAILAGGVIGVQLALFGIATYGLGMWGRGRRGG
jgi:hypothetical protein